MPFNNISNNYQTSRYIVDADGTTPFTTIQSAIDQVVLDTPSAPVTIQIRPGTYTENLVLVDAINLQGFSEGQVIIDGTHTPPVAGNISLLNIKFVSATDILFNAAAGACNISFLNCIFQCTNGYIFNMDLWLGDLSITNSSDLSLAGGVVFNSTGGAAIDIFDSQLGAGANVMTISGPARIFNSRVFCPTTFVLQASAAIQDSTIDNIVTVSNDAQLQLYNSYLNSAVACLSTSSTQRVIIGNVIFNSPAADVITGTGSVEIGESVYLDTASIAGTVTINRVNECAAGNLRAYGNLSLPATEDTGFGGIINVDGDQFIHAMGTRNSFVGQEAGNLLLTVANATDSVSLGFETLHDLTSGAYSTAIGSLSLAKLTSGEYSTAIGFDSLSALTTGNDNTACGADTLSSLLTGSKNLALGSIAGSALVGAESSNIYLANVGVAAESNTIRIGTNGAGLGQQDKTYVAGVYQATSGATKELVYVDSNHKLSSSNSGFTQWTTATVSMNMVGNTGYLVDIAVPGLLTLTLPAISNLYDVIEISGYSAGLWLLAQNAGQVIHYGNTDTTIGVGGSINAANRYDSIKIICVVPNLEWTVLSSQGTMIVV